LLIKEMKQLNHFADLSSCCDGLSSDINNLFLKEIIELEVIQCKLEVE